jgi:hypothetical protein
MTPMPAPVVRAWPGATVVCLGTGPSLTTADVEHCRGLRVIAVNNAYTLAPWADALYAADLKWWKWHKGVPDFAGAKYSVEPTIWAGVHALRNTGRTGLERDPSCLKTGYNSGYQAINLAVHLGAARIVLLGYDLKGDHFFGAHPDRSRPPFPLCLEAFPTLVAPLAEAGVEVINCTPGSSLRCFPMATLASVLERAA